MATAWLFIGPLQLQQTARRKSQLASIAVAQLPGCVLLILSTNGMTLAREDGGLWECLHI